MKVSDLKANPRNPRKITDKKLEMLAASMREFGDLSGVVLNVRTGHLVGGHQRVKNLDPKWKIIKRPAKDKSGTVAFGMIETPFGNLSYREVDWPIKKETQAMVSANQHGGDWDNDVLREVMAEMEAEDLEMLGFGEKELERLLRETDQPVQVNGDDQAEPLPSHVRMVQLFLTTETQPIFAERVTVLATAYKTQNVTDTVMEAIRKESERISGSKG